MTAVKDIAIYGAGGFGREVACLINNHLPQWRIIGFFDDDPTIKDKEVSYYGHCFGGFDVLNSWSSELAVVLAIGSPKAVTHIVDNITNTKITYPNIIHPNFETLDSKTFSIGIGNIITKDCRVSCNVSIGDFNVMNGSVIVGHDAQIGSYNSFMPAVRVSGGVKIGNGNFFGVASIVLQQLKIGNDIKLGAGSVLMTKPKDGLLYMGNPAKKTDL